MSTTILGDKIDFPICISPTAVQKLAHPDGEIATAKGDLKLSIDNSCSDLASDVSVIYTKASVYALCSMSSVLIQFII